MHKDGTVQGGIPKVFPIEDVGIKGGTSRIMTIGDPHISDRYSGRHVDYFRDCVEWLDQVTEMIIKHKVTHLIVTGDWVGRLTEKNLQLRETLLYMIKVLQKWNELTNGNVYSITGNHDMSEKLTDYQVFVSLGLIKTGLDIDVNSVRFHLMDYGDHKRKLNIDESKYNVAVMHTELHVEGQTNWIFRSKEGVMLSSLDNLEGVKFVIAGHIHTPSEKTAVTSINGKDISLFYPGNGTRPSYDKNIWTHSYGVLFEADDEGADLQLVTFELRPPAEIFQRVMDDIEIEEEAEEQSNNTSFNLDELSDILKQLTEYNLMGDGSYKEQITKLGGLDESAVALALDYIEQVEGELK